MHVDKLTSQRITRISIRFFIFLIILLPAGNLFGVNVKIISMITLIITFLICVCKKNIINLVSVKLIMFLIVGAFFIIVNYFLATPVAISKGYANTEMMLFSSYILSTVIILVAISEKIITKQLIRSSIIFYCAIYSTIKIIFIVMSIIGVISLYDVSMYIYSTWGIKPMLFPITDTLSRFQLANDYIVCFSLFFMVCSKNTLAQYSNTRYFLYIMIIALSVLISFSRYMILLMFVAMIIRIFHSNRKDKLVIWSIIIGLFLLCIYITNSELIGNVVDLRFSSDANESSDASRTMQVDCLFREFSQSPLLGHGGLGDYSLNCPGPTDAEFSYEVQYLGYLYRFGLFQTILILIIIISLFVVFLRGNVFSRNNLAPSVAFFSWMLIGFFNPYLVSAYASVIIILCVSFLPEMRNDDSLHNMR